VHAQFLHQLPLTGDAIRLINRMRSRSSDQWKDGRYRCNSLRSRKADVRFNQPQMSLRNLIFQTEVAEQRFGAVAAPS
jgi:hypothetical protein